MSAATPDLTLCDREPIHIPGSIQPHGMMLVVDPETLTVIHAAGEVEERLGKADWQGSSVADLLGDRVAAELRRVVQARTRAAMNGVAPPFTAETFDVAMHISAGYAIVELEPTLQENSPVLLPQIEAAAAAFERSPTMEQFYDIAAREFQRLSDYDRVMIYRFLDDDSGVVVGEHTRSGLPSFMHHRFPASDIPKQARQLYVRNLVRVIPDVTYRPAPLRPAWPGAEPLDMSDCMLRSVSPVHLQYLNNMGVAASASISIVKDGALWGLIACHNAEPKLFPADRRAACRALAGGLARQIRAREETDAYRERVRLRTYEDDIVALLSREGSLDKAMSNHIGEVMRMLDADGLAVLRGDDLLLGGRCPPEAEVRKLAAWALERSVGTVFATDRLSQAYPLPEEHKGVAAGMLALTLSTTDPWIVLWFRAEEVEVVNWAGNPHEKQTGPGGALTPRRSFEAWTETVRGRARRWTLPEVEAAGRLRAAVIAVWQNRRIRDLNRQLLNTLDEKELLIKQKEFLIGEVNHRVQNSLQLVSSFLTLQMRASDDQASNTVLEEARRRISAVSLVHRRLYRADQVDAIDAARYLDELLADLVASMGPAWQENLVRDLQPIMLPTDRAIALGLILTELVINANKYAYGGGTGPLRITLTGEGNRMRLIVADSGGGRATTRTGFGSRMMEALVGQLAGTLEFEDNQPGTRAVLTAPIERK